MFLEGRNKVSNRRDTIPLDRGAFNCPEELHNVEDNKTGRGGHSTCGLSKVLWLRTPKGSDGKLKSGQCQ